ncbi:hypothetical protein CICLE_v10013699mg [Citrus x clementina]|uniref:Protein MIZU-KUSSEI 1 n=1 Tax=Citrus clementina TaxID=85681 RepID=V4STX3_CITCL|nr:protein MIZU-KUSSEI 1 [Citrus x clementina]ESR42450.1 hypothetical protein CICLE_v10013699mg [Citrus x clementina]
MSKIRRFFLPCIFPTAADAQTTPASKKRLSTSLRDDIDEPTNTKSAAADQEAQNPDQEPTSPEDNSTTLLIVPPRPSKSMVIGTIFGHRRGHVWFCIQQDRVSMKPTLLLELSMPTNQLVKEMRCGLVRIALECARPESTERIEVTSCPLRLVPVWIMYCNGRKVGFAVRRKASGQNRLMLKMMQSITIGAGVIPAGLGSSGPDSGEQIIYMRANYEHMIGSADSESFHLINPDECAGQEFSLFLLRSR